MVRLLYRMALFRVEIRLWRVKLGFCLLVAILSRSTSFQIILGLVGDLLVRFHYFHSQLYLTSSKLSELQII